MKSKYNAEKTVIDGITFDSKVEGEYYLYLIELKREGLIKSFSLQPEYILQDKFSHSKYGNQRSINYKADFLVNFFDGDTRVVDIKGAATPEALIKRKMFLLKRPYDHLIWLSKSKKHGTHGWIDYFELKKIRAKNKKNKKNKK